MADVKWIKIVTDIFDNRKIKQIEALPQGDTIIVIWFKLICLAGTINDNGYIYITDEIPYTDETMATQFNRNIKVIQLAIKTFQSYGMVEIIDDVLKISNWEKYQNIEGMEKMRELTKARVRKYREKQKMLNGNVTSNVTVTDSNETDKIRIDKIIKIYDEEIGTVTPTVKETFIPYLEVLGEEMVIKAIKLSVEHNKKNIAYIKAILNNWLSKGYKSLDDIKPLPKPLTKNKKTNASSLVTNENLNELYDN